MMKSSTYYVDEVYSENPRLVCGIGVNIFQKITKNISANYVTTVYVVVVVVVVVVVFTLKAVPVSTQYFLTSVLVQLTRTPSVVTR